jgi:hypothetical protein
MAQAITHEHDHTPTDLEEAEAIAAGTTMLLAERRHVVALFLALQQARLDKDLQAEFIRAQREGFVLRIEEESRLGEMRRQELRRREVEHHHV